MYQRNRAGYSKVNYYERSDWTFESTKIAKQIPLNSAAKYDDVS